MKRSAADRPVVRAAGGLVLRPGVAGGLETVLVHRPRYDDWSLPKGKAHRKERDDAAALREVEEETGLRCRLGQELVRVEYETPKGEPKVVRWWEMTIEKDLGFRPDDEVDEIRWVALDEVAAVATLPSDATVVHSYVASRS